MSHSIFVKVFLNVHVVIAYRIKVYFILFFATAPSCMRETWQFCRCLFSDGKTYYPVMPGMHGLASTEGGSGWRNSYHAFKATADTVLRNLSGNLRGKGWTDLRNRLLVGSSGSLRSGAGYGSGGGGGGGGYEGGFNDPLSANSLSGGGGGGSFCNATEAASCSLTTGGNGDPAGYVIIERISCFWRQLGNWTVSAPAVRCFIHQNATNSIISVFSPPSAQNICS